MIISEYINVLRHSAVVSLNLVAQREFIFHETVWKTKLT